MIICQCHEKVCFPDERTMPKIWTSTTYSPHCILTPSNGWAEHMTPSFEYLTQPIDHIRNPLTTLSPVTQQSAGQYMAWWRLDDHALHKCRGAKQYANDCNPLTSSHAGNNKDLTPVSSTVMSASTSRKVRPHPFQGDHNKTSPGEITPPFPNFISEVGSLEVAWKTCLKTLLP